jgi:hypothetical protein
MTQTALYTGDCIEVLKRLPAESVQCVVTSPPYYGLRDYGHAGQIGLEQTPDDYVAKMVEVFREVRRVLRDDGTVWLNIGDSYAGSGKGGQSAEKRSAGWQPTYANKGYVPPDCKPKDLMGIPWLLALALRADGWYLRQDIIWHKPNVMPEPALDRCVKAHEYLFLLSKSQRYYFDAEAVKESAVGGDEKRNRRSVWTIPTRPFKEAHFAVMPEALVEPCVLAGSKAGDTILDPFTGSGTVAVVAERHGRSFVGAELNPEYAQIAWGRIAGARIANALNQTVDRAVVH